MSLIIKYWPYLALTCIVVIGLFLRVFDLSVIPTGLYPDVAKYANDAITTFTQNDWRVFYPENNGREGLYIWLLALSFKFFGVSIFSLKIVGAIAGILTIITTYLATKEVFLFCTQNNGAHTQARFSFFAREVASLLAAGFLATSFWHINFSRVGFRAILVPLFLSAGFYFTLRAMARRNLLDTLIAGIIWGAGYYTYIAFRFAFLIPVFLVLALLIVYIFQNKPRASWQWFYELHRAYWRPALIAITAITTMSPLLRYFLQNPQDFVSRTTGISIFEEPSPALAFLKSLGLNLQMLFVNGDSNWRHNMPGDAQLFWPVALLFLAGIIYSIWVMYEGIKYRNWNMLIVHLTLYVWFFAMLLPAALTIEGVPHALRAIGLMPVVFIFASFGFLVFVKLVFSQKHYRADFWPFGIGAALIIILLSASFQFNHYFNNWGKNDEVKGAFTQPFVEIGNYFNGLGRDVQKVLIVNEVGVDVSYPREILAENNTAGTLPMPAQTILFIQQTKEMPIQNTTYIRAQNLPLSIYEKAVLVPLRADNEIKNRLRILYPIGQERQFENFWGWQIGSY